MNEGILYLTAEPPICSVTYAGSDKVTFSGADGDLITTVKADDTVYFKATPDSGYALGAVSVKTCGGASVTLFVSDSIYSFTVPVDDVTVTVGLTVSVPAAVTALVYVGSTWTQGSTSGLLISFDAPLAKFDSVKIDGNTIAAANYTAEEGAAKITLAPTYLDIGAHFIEIVSNDRCASTYFIIKATVPPVPTSYTVIFNMNGHGTQIAAQAVKEGEKATRPTDPKASGYTFGGWYADATCSTKVNFNAAITAGTTVYAKWTKNSVT